MKKDDLLRLCQGVGVSRDVAQRVIQAKLNLKKEAFFVKEDIMLSQEKLDEIIELLRKIAFGYQIEYAIQKAEFYGRDFFVDKRCLIPRDETEVLVRQTLEYIDGMTHGSIFYVDIGAGSGAIPITIALESRSKNIESIQAVDISKEALEVSRINRDNYGLEGTIALKESDLLEGIDLSNSDKGCTYVFTANLPYIKNADYTNMDVSVVEHEPSVALYGGKKTGFELYEKLIYSIEKKFARSGKEAILFIEIGFDQAVIARDFLSTLQLEYRLHVDTAGIERCIEIRF